MLVIFIFIFLLFSTFIFMFSFISGRKHLLATLLSLEGAMLMIFGLLSWMSALWANFSCFIFMFLVFTACEGALGLSLLVVVVRWWGSDRVLSLNLLQS